MCAGKPVNYIIAEELKIVGNTIAITFIVVFSGKILLELNTYLITAIAWC